MMKRDYILYILLLILILLAGLIVWPNRWINIDIGNFHYHKMWEGPNLSDLTLDSIEHDLDLDLGMDFVGSSENKLNVIFTEQSEDHAKKVAEAVRILRNRLQAAGFVESTVTFKKEGDEYYIYVKVRGSKEAFESSQHLITQKGVLELWGGKGEEVASEDPSASSGQEVDPFRQFLEQSYTKLDLDLSDFKGIKVGREEEVYFIGIGLTDEQSEKLKEEVYKFWGKSLIAVLDSALFPIDGSDLGEQMSFYGKARSIKISGFSEKEDAKVNTAIINNGVLPVDLVVSESYDQDPILGEEFLNKGLVGGGVTLALIMIMLFIFFGNDGLVGAFSLALFLLFFLACIKVFHMRLAIGSILAFMLVVSSYIALLVFTFLRSQKKAMAISTDLFRFLRDKDIVEFNNNFLIVQFVLGFMLFVLAPVFSKYFALVLLIGVFFEYIVLDQILPFCYKVINLINRSGG